MKEIWHGKRWQDLKWFWDPNSRFLLPFVCINCETVISTDTIKSSVGFNEQSTCSVICLTCGKSQVHQPLFANGSPLNIGVICHWDGWQPFGTSSRGCGAIEICVANFKKEKQNHADEVFVVGFVPIYLLPKQNLDPFLQPLMEDTVSVYVSGINVVSLPIDSHDFMSHGTETIRVLILLMTGDHPAQCECGKFLNQGKAGCRRCKIIGQHCNNPDNNQMYYGQNRYHSRFPWAKRKLHEEIAIINSVESEHRITYRKKMASLSGFTGVSILHKYLFPLYGFDVLRDLVFDVFHTVPLNVVKNMLNFVLSKGICKTEDIDNLLKTFPRTSELRNGRMPSQIKKIVKV